jgi:mRNA interferase MazF
VAGGSGYTGKPRPSVIVQSDLYGGLLSVVICPFTSEIEDVITVRPLVAPNPFNGLAAPSRVMVDKVGAVPAARLGRQLGRLGDEDIARIDQALLAFLGLAG